MSLRIIDGDAAWFKQHRERRTRIRSAIGNESNGEFLSLGPHDRNRRRIICLKIPETGQIMKIPFLAFADEEIRNEDETLLPIIDGIMREAAARYGVPTR